MGMVAAYSARAMLANPRSNYHDYGHCVSCRVNAPLIHNKDCLDPIKISLVRGIGRGVPNDLFRGNVST